MAYPPTFTQKNQANVGKYIVRPMDSMGYSPIQQENGSTCGITPEDFFPVFIGIHYMGVSKNTGSPKWMVKIMENPMKNG